MAIILDGAEGITVPAGASGAQVLLRLGAYAPLPTSDIGPIWHDGYGGILTWQEIGSYEGYASARLAEVTFRAVDEPLPGTLVANGATVSRTTYAALFAVIGTTFGVGDGATTFNLPDMRGEFIRGWDAGRGADAGRVFGSAQADAFKSHNHPLNNVYSNRAGSPNWKVGLGAEVYFNYQNFSTDAAGGTETRPRNIALLPMIYY